MPDELAAVNLSDPRAPIEGEQHLFAIVECESTEAASTAAAFVESVFGDRLTGLLRMEGSAPPSFPSKGDVLCELGCDVPGADRCVDCGEPLTIANEPEGVIYIRARVAGVWSTVAICSSDYHARREMRLPDEPTRVLHE